MTDYRATALDAAFRCMDGASAESIVDAAKKFLHFLEGRNEAIDITTGSRIDLSRPVTLTADEARNAAYDLLLQSSLVPITRNEDPGWDAAIKASLLDIVQPEEKVKRKRRTKAEIEAAAQADDTPPARSGIVIVSQGPVDVVETPLVRSAPTNDELRHLSTQLAESTGPGNKRRGPEAIGKMLEPYGVQRVSELKPEQAAEYAKKVRGILFGSQEAA